MHKRKIKIAMFALFFILPISGCSRALTYVEGKSATCLDAGVAAHYTDGSAKFSDKAGKDELIDVTLPALGHDFIVVTKAASCKSEGESLRRCTRCGLEEKEELLKTEHVYYGFRTLKEATCTEDGVKVKTCAICGDCEKEALPAYGHSYSTENVCIHCGDEIIGSETLEYTALSEMGYSVSGIGGATSELTLPLYYKGLPVLSIENNAFNGHDEIESVSIYAQLKSVGVNAFRNCSSLKEIILPDSVETVGAYAFYNCTAIKHIHIGKNLKEIGQAAFLFHGGSSLEKITVSDENKIYRIEGNCLLTGDVLLLGSIHAEIVSGVKEIASYAFYGLPQTEIVLPVTVRKIGAYAFGGGERALRFLGTKAEWETIEKETGWESSVTSVICSDAEIKIV